MSPATLTPSPRRLWTGDPPVDPLNVTGGAPSEPPRDEEPPAPARPPRRRRTPIAVMLVMSALVGGGAGAAVVAAARGGSTNTVIERSTTTATSRSTGGGLDAQSLYAATSAGVVDITVRGPQGGGSGTGFVVDQDGHIVTAAHVVDNADTVTVKLQDGTTRTAKVLGKDDATDVAVIEIDPSGLTLHPLALGSSSSVKIGAEVAAIGDPFGYSRSLSTGIVSGVDRTIEAPNGFTVAHAIQTDAAINPGNSGGPVLDADGNVIGIADQIATGGGADQSAGVGFAVPIDLVKSSLNALISGGAVEHAYLGISTGDGSSSGAAISAVTSGGPAAAGGLEGGDVITSFDGKAISDSNGLVAAIAAHKPGDQVKLTVKRGSGTQELTVTLGKQPAQRSSAGSRP